VRFLLWGSDGDNDSAGISGGAVRAGAERLRQYYQQSRARTGDGNQYYPGVQWDIRDKPWRFLAIIDLPLSLVVDTLLLPVDASHGPYE